MSIPMKVVGYAVHMPGSALAVRYSSTFCNNNKKAITTYTKRYTAE